MNLKCKANDMKHGLMLNLFKTTFKFFRKSSVKFHKFLISPVGGHYVTGGGGMSSQVDVVDVSSGETSRGQSMLHPRQWHAAAASPTSLFVFGGYRSGTNNSCVVAKQQ